MAESITQILSLIADVSQHHELSIDERLEYLNSFYQNQFFIDIGMNSIEKTWNFQTLPNVDEYSVSETYRLIKNKEVQLNGQFIEMYFDKVLFDSYYPDAYHIDETIGTGDGSTVAFTGTLDSDPVVFNSMIVSDGVETFKDNGSGVLTGSLTGTGTITYSTGVYSVIFNTAPVDSANIYATYAEYTASQPSVVLFYDNILKFRPIPDKSYDINIQVAQRFATLTESSELPNAIWGDALAYGTCVDILNRFGNEEDAAFANRNYNRKMQSVLGHQYKQRVSTQRAVPRW